MRKSAAHFDPVAGWRSLVSEAADIRMAEMVETICRNADQEARRLVGPAFLSRMRGQLRYFGVESGFLGLGGEFSELSTQLELHLGNTSNFSAIDRPDLRLTLARLDAYDDNPFGRPFRRGNLTQAQSRRFVAGQTSFLGFPRPSRRRLVAALCFGFDKEHGFDVPAYTEIRFADADWQCQNRFHDIRALLLKSREVPVETVGDARGTRERIVASEKVVDQRHTPARRERAKRDA